MCRLKQAYNYSDGPRRNEPKVACSFHMDESLWRRLGTAQIDLGVDGVVICHKALEEHLTGLGY